MPRYRRSRVQGGTYFFTVALARRDRALLIDHIDAFREAYRKVAETLPFSTIAICVLPDHVHAVWQLPEGDADFSARWSGIKADSRARCRRLDSAARVRRPSARRAYGNAVSGSTRFVTKRI